MNAEKKDTWAFYESSEDDYFLLQKEDNFSKKSKWLPKRIDNNLISFWDSMD